jgi:hypothetical protein
MAREPRFSSDLPVLVVGRDALGNRFKQTAKVENISRLGALLTQIRCISAPGDIIEVEHRGKRADFRVAWIDVPSGRAGIRCNDAYKYIWRTKLPCVTSTSGQLESSQAASKRIVAPADTEAKRPDLLQASAERGYRESVSIDRLPPRPPTGAKPQRRFPRYRCSGGVTATVKGVPTKIWGQLSSIALGGCYIDTISPFPPKTKLELLIGAHGVQTTLQGEVRYSQPGFGMGIMFTAMWEDSSKELERILVACRKLMNF